MNKSACPRMGVNKKGQIAQYLHEGIVRVNLPKIIVFSLKQIKRARCKTVQLGTGKNITVIPHRKCLKWFLIFTLMWFKSVLWMNGPIKKDKDPTLCLRRSTHSTSVGSLLRLAPICHVRAPDLGGQKCIIWGRYSEVPWIRLPMVCWKTKKFRSCMT